MGIELQRRIGIEEGIGKNLVWDICPKAYGGCPMAHNLWHFEEVCVDNYPYLCEEYRKG